MRSVCSVAIAASLLPLGSSAALSAQDSAQDAAQDSAQVVEAPAPTASDLEIYALAVDSSRFPDEQFVVLLRERRVRVERDGTWKATTRNVIQLRSEGAARAAAEISLGYDSGRENLELDWGRVVDSDGTVLSGPIQLQVLDVPVGRASPIYTDGKTLRASLGGAEAGRIVDVRYTRTFTDPAMPGDWLQSWGANAGQPVRRARFVLDLPEDLESRLHEQNMPGPPRIERRGDRVTREWYHEDLDPVEGEPFAADSNSVHMGVHVSGPLTWNEVADWYVALTADHYQLTPDLEAALASVVDGATSIEDSLRAVHRWVAQDIRYLSLSLGLGGYQPKLPDEVLRTGAGDCKDKVTLFITLARHLGAEAHPVLVRSSGPVYAGLPSLRQFNHMVVALRVEDAWRYLDLTVPVAPFDENFGQLDGRTGVMLLADGTAEVVDFPTRPASENRSSIVVEGELGDDGTLVVEYTEIVTGAIQYRIRSEFDSERDERRMQSLHRGLAQRVGRNGVTDSVEVLDGLDLETTPRLWAQVRVGDALTEVPGGWLLPLRVASYGNPSIIEQLQADDAREFPIDVEKVFGLREHVTVYRIRLPDGWTADLPNDVSVTSAFGFYESIYAQEGRELQIRRTIRGADGVLPPEAVEELIEWFRILADDHVENIVLRVEG